MIIGNKEIKTVQEISREDVVAFYRATNKENRDWLMSATAAAIELKGAKEYFATLRSDFVTKFFPELFSSKTYKKQSILADYADIDCAS